MAEEPKRLLEIRLLVIVTVDLRHSELLAALKGMSGTPALTEVVASEVSSNLDSVSYVESCVVCRL